MDEILLALLINKKEVKLKKLWRTIFILTIVWVLFPAVLFGWIANKTKNVGVKWAVRFLIWIIPIELVIVLLSF